MIAQTCKACKVAFYNIKRSRRLGLIPSAGIATADTWFKCFLHKGFPRKHVLVLVDLSTLGIPHTDSIWMRKRQLKKTHYDLNPQSNRHSDFVALSGSLALYCAASSTHDDCLIANDNPDLWFLVILLLLVRNDLIQLAEDNIADSLGLLRTVANFFKTLNRQISFLKQTNIP